MLDLGMAAGSLAGAVKVAWWSFRPTWLRGLENGTATSTADLVEDGFETAIAGSFMAE